MLSKYPAWRLQKKMTTVASTRAVNAFKDSLPSWVPKPECLLTAIGEELLVWDWGGGYVEVVFDDYGAGELYACAKIEGIAVSECYVPKCYGLSGGVLEVFETYFRAYQHQPSKA